MNEQGNMNTDSAVNNKKETPRRNGKRGKRLLRLLLPLLLIASVAGVPYLPKTEPPEEGTSMKTLEVKGFPLTLAFENRDGVIKSAWLRSPAGTREIDSMNGLSYISGGVFTTKGGQGNKEDLLWRTSYTSFDGSGIHLWIGISNASSKIFISTTKYSHTKWDNVPAKFVVPKGTALYISPAIPAYGDEETFQGKDYYSFVYTIRMTPEGPAFVPVPSVYRQLAELLRAGIRGEHSPIKRLAYTRMLEEFTRLAEGNPPATETLLNFQINKIDTLGWRY